MDKLLNALSVFMSDDMLRHLKNHTDDTAVRLTVDGRDCPGCNSPQRLCQSPRTDVLVPGGVDRQQFLQQLIANVDPGESQAVGLGASGSFYLDVSTLSQLNEQKILGLLSATSIALQNFGQPVNTRAAMTAAHNILSE